jgi:hypothetical protein
MNSPEKSASDDVTAKVPASETADEEGDPRP